jgi:hypothetical protein
MTFEYRWAAGKSERLPAPAADLMGLKVDIIVTSGVPAAKALGPTLPQSLLLCADEVIQ